MTNTATNNLPSVNEIVKSVLNIRSEATEWNNTACKTANEGLYVLLRKSYEQCDILRAHDIEVRTDFTKALEDKGYPFNSGTSIEAKVLRVVFDIKDAKNKRIHRYANVLRVAKADKISSEDFVKWLSKSGGIDCVESTNQAKERDTRIEKAKKEFAELYRIALKDVLSKNITDAKASEGDMCNFSVALVRHSKDNETEVVGLSNSDSITKSLLLNLKKQFEEEVNNAHSDEKNDAVQQNKDAIRNKSEQQAQAVAQQ